MGMSDFDKAQNEWMRRQESISDKQIRAFKDGFHAALSAQQSEAVGCEYPMECPPEHSPNCRMHYAQPQVAVSVGDAMVERAYTYAARNHPWYAPTTHDEWRSLLTAALRPDTVGEK